MLEMKADAKEKKVLIEAMGCTDELLEEYALMTATLAHSMMRPNNRRSELENTANAMLGACVVGLKKGLSRRMKELLHEE